MKDLLREDGGLTYLFDLLSSSRVEQIRNATMFCIGCALERNGITQSCLLLLIRLAQFSNLCNVTCFVIMCSVKINNVIAQGLHPTFSFQPETLFRIR